MISSIVTSLFTNITNMPKQSNIVRKNPNEKVKEPVKIVGPPISL